MKYIKPVCLLIIVIAAICVWQVLIPAQTEESITIVDEDVQEVNEVQQPQPTAPIPDKKNTKVATKKRTMVPVKPKVEEIDFYQTIIDNNIFRPLGFRPVRQSPRYKLIGSNIAEQEHNTTAVILEYNSQKLFIVGVDDEIRKNMSVKEIKEKQVILHDGENEIKLYGSEPMFLNYK